ncbi:MAG: family 20 glycosylhydrolase [Bacteroidaceae bacterium]|nr:family 20 glycosylhydrolase [Bacteroidaceae bacterium]
MKRFVLFLLLALAVVSLAAQGQDLRLIPYPCYMQAEEGMYAPEGGVATVFTNLRGTDRGELLDYIAASSLPLRAVRRQEGAHVRLLLDNLDPSFTHPEAYRVEITPQGADCYACDVRGLFYAFQTLLWLDGQRVPAGTGRHSLPLVKIYDAPRLEWRGWHMDVSRHYFDKEFLKKQLRMMARYKMNRFHWHLVDDAGWRLEVKRYPELTDSTAFRPWRLWEDWGRAGGRFCSARSKGAYGGYFTQRDVREIVEYARRLHITVVPEIDVPGHSRAVLAAYPSLGCTGKAYENSELCLGAEKTFEFVTGVLSEIIDLFPDEYIHIGGDEADRSHWARCPRCQDLMRREGLQGVEELQSWFTRRVEDWLTSRGRKLIGWDEIMEGGLSSRATVMAWRGEKWGVQAAREGHDVVMTPWQCYLDNAQDDLTTEPRGVGGYVPLRLTYDFDPVPAGLSEAEAAHILGLQGNVWTERIATPQHAEYMIYPRICAIAENGWTLPERKSWERFYTFALDEVDHLHQAGYNAFNLAAEKGDREEAQGPVEHLAVGHSPVYTHPASAKYPGRHGEATLTDGERGSYNYQQGQWLGFEDEDCEVTIDLDSVVTVHEVSADFMQRADQWIWLPAGVVVSASQDGTQWTVLSNEPWEPDFDDPMIRFQRFGWQGTTEARFVRLSAKASGRRGGWLFTDEIIVR